MSWQKDFPEITICDDCDSEARLAFVAHEMEPEDEPHICSLYSNEPNSFWPHDSIAVAVYFCKRCGKCVAEYNQA